MHCDSEYISDYPDKENEVNFIENEKSGDFSSLTEHYIDESLNLLPSEDLHAPSMAKQPDIIDERFIRHLLDAAYRQDETFLDVPYRRDETPIHTSSPSVLERPKRILMRELSYDDDRTDPSGVDLMAPVYLAITEDGGGAELNKRQSKSIVDLCSTTLHDEEVSEEIAGRARSKSLDTTTKSHFLSTATSFDDPCTSTAGDIYNESIDDSLEEQAFIDVMVRQDGSFDDVSGITFRSSFGSMSSLASFEHDDYPPLVSDFSPEEERRCLKEPQNYSTPTKVQKLCMQNGEQPCYTKTTYTTKNGCAFWEYPLDLTTSDDIADRSVNTSTNTCSNTNPLKRYVAVSVAGVRKTIDMKLLQSYVKVLSHGGKHKLGEENRVIIVFGACYLPKTTHKDYAIIMEQLLYYCCHAVDLLVPDTYEIVFFNSGACAEQRPNNTWLKNAYSVIEHRLRKRLKRIYFVHPTLWVKTVIQFSSLFISSKFLRKIRFMKNIATLKKYLPLEYLFIPPEIHKIDKLFT